MQETRKAPMPRGMRGMGPRAKFNKESFKRILNYMLKYKFQYLLVLLCILVSSVVQVISQLFLQTLIDDYIAPLIGQTNPEYVHLLKFLLLMAGIYVFGIVCTFTYNRLMANVSQSILRDVRNDLFNHMEQLPISYFDTHSHGDIMSRYTNDIDTLRQMIGQSVPTLFSSVFSIISIFISMLTLNVPLTFAVVIGVVVMTFVTKNILMKSGKYFVKQQESLGNLNGYIEEMIDGQKVVKVFTHEEEAKNKFDELNNLLCENSTKANTYANIMGPINNNIGHLIYVIIAFVGSMIAIKTNAFSIGAIASFLALTKSFTMPVSQISQQFNSIVMAIAGAARIFEMMDEKKEENEGTISIVQVKKENDKLIETNEKTELWAWKDGENLTLVQGDVRLYDVHFGYEKEKEILHDITLYAKPGQKIAFVGSTGAGKTTITNLLNRFYDVDSGAITFDGIDIMSINKDSLRKSIAVVLQETNLFTGTIMENIRYGKIDATDEECIAAARLANADDFINMLPDGYNTLITGNGSNLSQGQRQLLSIARCAVADPPVMILDEATSSIDTRTEKIVQDGMDKLMDGRTVFVIAHRLSTVQNSKAIMVLEKGNIIERGDHDDLIKQKGKYYELYNGVFELE